MESFIDSSIPVFIGLTVILFGGAALLTGQALAATWRPPGMAVAYTLLLGAGDRFLHYGLFDGELLSFTGYLSSFVVLLVICLIAYRITQVNTMITQYPWLYERSGLFAWREKNG